MNSVQMLFSIAPSPQRQFTADEILALRAPIVYAWIRGEDVLYVGMSTCGLERPLSSGHHRLWDLQSQDSVILWRLDSAMAARKLEARLIVALQPKLNNDKFGVGDRKPPQGRWGRWIFKRGESWYVEFQANGERYRKCLGEVSLGSARLIAKRIRDEVVRDLAEKRGVALKLPSHLPPRVQRA